MNQIKVGEVGLVDRGIELGKYVIGHLLVNTYDFQTANEYLTPIKFVGDAQQKVVEAIWGKALKDNNFDMPYVATALGRKTDSLYNEYCKDLNFDFESLCSLLSENYKLRIELAISDQTKYLIEKGVSAEEIISEVSGIRKESRAYDEYGGAWTWEDHQKWMLNRIKGLPVEGITNPYSKKLGRLVPVWMGGTLLVRAGRPGMGKTQAMLSEVYELITNDVPVGVFSMEMSEQQNMNRLVSIHTDIPIRNDFPRGLVEGEQVFVYDSIEELKAMPLHLYCKSYRLENLLNDALRLVREKGVKIIYIDYMQLIRIDLGRNSNREREVARISNELKGLATRAKVPVVALCQMSRAVESRANKKPQLSDLRNSGEIEQDAGVVEFFYRPEYYNIYRDKKGNSLKGIVERIVAKNRDGGEGDGLGIVKFKTMRGGRLIEDEIGYDEFEEVEEVEEVQTLPRAEVHKKISNGFDEELPF